MQHTSLCCATLALSLFLTFAPLATWTLDNGLARRPPMGWMTWQRYRCNVDCKKYPNDCINEALIKRQADALVEEGYAAAGYKYVVVDDCWFAAERDPTTNKLRPDPERFPNGMKHLGDYVHSKGLLFGIYLDMGNLTCGGYPGSQGHLELDAQTLAEWGADYTKVDGCYADIDKMPDNYENLGQYLNATGRPMVYSCSYPAYISWINATNSIDWKRLAHVCNLWRMYDDINDSWSSLSSITRMYAGQSRELEASAAPGSWNDPDMLLLGNYGLSPTQIKTQMALWAMFAAPLFISADLTKVNHYENYYLKHKRLLEINQDSAGRQAKFVKEDKQGCHYWYRMLQDGDALCTIAIVNYSTGGPPLNVIVNLHDFSTNQPSSLNEKLFEKKIIRDTKSKYTLRDVLSGQIAYTNINVNKIFSLYIKPNGVAILDIIKQTN